MPRSQSTWGPYFKLLVVKYWRIRSRLTKSELKFYMRQHQNQLHVAILFSWYSWCSTWTLTVETLVTLTATLQEWNWYMTASFFLILFLISNIIEEKVMCCCIVIAPENFLCFIVTPSALVLSLVTTEKSLVPHLHFLPCNNNTHW